MAEHPTSDSVLSTLEAERRVPIFPELSRDERSDQAGLLEDLRSRRIDGLVIRGLFDHGAALKVGARLDALHQSPDHGGLLWLSGRSKRNSLFALGHPLAPTPMCPSGPDEDWYLRQHAEVLTRQPEIFDEEYRYLEEVEATFNCLAGGTRTTPYTAPDGRPYGQISVRGFPVETGFLPHAEQMYTSLPLFDRFRDELDMRNMIAFFTPVSKAGGGELVTYGGAWGDTMLNYGDLPADLDAYPQRIVPMEPGDLVIFGAGRLVHEVRPVLGVDIRWTLGGFAAFQPSQGRWRYWV